MPTHLRDGSTSGGGECPVVQTLMRHRLLASTMLYCAVDEAERLDGINRLGTTVPVVRTVPDVSPIWDIPSTVARMAIGHDRSHALEPVANLGEGPEVTALRAALAAALATRHPTATPTEDGRADTVRYLATLAKEARDAAAGEDATV
jgi:hypothetical protein